MKKLALIKQKYAVEREHLLGEMKNLESQINQLKATNEGQLRLI